MRGPGPPPTQRLDLSHHLIDIPVGDDGDVVAARAWTMGAVGVEELDDRLRVAFTDHASAIAAARLLGGTPPTPVADTTGLDAWRDHARVIEAEPFLVHPPWLPAPAGDLVLSIDPGHAFGSGSHPSTRLALGLLAAVVHPDHTVLDVGCGSGVLAVAAARLGATVTATDIDPEALRATRANASTNEVDDRVHVVTVDELAGPFDVVVVNMTVDLHEVVAPSMRHVLDETTVILTAGILAGPQEGRVAAAWDATIDRRLVDGEWIGLELGRLRHRE